ncbi:hypothetical protein E0L36_19575 [Streptomyces sp. AJS327]|uniref:hypothetical protein n=1 Tax=Streptomyces sp. AJS327 TaxID=2545265 RepID=UPI0015DEB38D|nr:hypothetical protein [Streptomyces sp. AJS327]MBA0052991.1 hypothetical protein [Streptomyces sp. AJS327]
MEHEVYVPFSMDSVRAALSEPGRVARCVPGLQRDAGDGREPSGEESGPVGSPITGRLRVRVGGSTITYRGSLSVSPRDEGFEVEGGGAEARGGAAVQLMLSVLPRAADDGVGTVLECSGTVEAEGRLTEFEQRTVTAAGRRLLDRFGVALGESLTADPAPVVSEAAEPAPTVGGIGEPDDNERAIPGIPGPDPERAGEARGQGAEPVPGPEPATSADEVASAGETAGAGETVGADETGADAARTDDDGTDVASGSPTSASSSSGSPEPGASGSPGAEGGSGGRSGGGSDSEPGGAGQEPAAQEPPVSRGEGPPEGRPEPDHGGLFGTEIPPPSLDPVEEDAFDEAEHPGVVSGADGSPVTAEAAHARRTMIGRSAEEVDHAPPRGRYAPVAAPEATGAVTTLRWAAPAAALLIAGALVLGRALRRRRH